MIRNTVQRQIILEALKKSNTHPTVEALYMEIHKSHPTISKATVYRNLRQFAQDNEIRQLFLTDELARYDKRADQHHHFKCKHCGLFYDVDVDYRKEMDETVAQKYGFQVDGHDVVFRGSCPSCEGKTTSKSNVREG